MTRSKLWGWIVERLRSPARVLLAGAVICVLAVAGATSFALATPSLGLRLAADFDAGTVHVVAAQGPGAEVPVGSTVVALVGAGGERFELRATDLIEEPDFLDTYEEMAAFFERQTVLARLLEGERVEVVLGGTSGDSVTIAPVTIAPTGRALEALPFVYWFQCFSGCAGFLIGLWVLALSPRMLGARLFAALGAMFLVFSVSAAPYSTRELVLDGAWFRTLSALNHTGAFLFGAALVALMASYPKQLVPPRWLLLVPAVIVPWLAADLLHLAPNQDVGSRMPVMLETVTAMLLAGGQWLASRGDPGARAALRWVGTAVITGPALFVFTTAGSSLVGGLPPIQQGYAFGFFLLMYVGLALGLRRHSLLGIDEWALRILIWLGAGVALVVLDLALVLVLGASQAVSLGVSLAICGLAYLPVRNWLWEKIVVRKRVDQQELFQRVLRAAFAANSEERATLWVGLLKKVFDPLEVDPRVTLRGERVVIAREGLQLTVPAIASLPAVRLAYPWGGRGLFAPRHRDLAEALVQLMYHAESAREAFLRGVKEERHRIARDLHDHLGAQLLTGLYAESAEQARDGIRHALFDMRTVVHELTGEKDLPVEEVLADLRHEVADRLRAASVELEWPLQVSDPEATSGDAEATPRMSPRVCRHLTAVLREVVSNVVRHARATRVLILSEVRDDRLYLSVVDDGIGLTEPRGVRSPAAGGGEQGPESRIVPGAGRGLTNLRARVGAIGGTLELCDRRVSGGTLPDPVVAWAGAAGAGTSLELDIPLKETHPEVLAS
jgi:two-component system sensor histidine kinase DevS